ncbi:unnamed protein product [Urochloa decumbens]|uniref:Methyltransferase-like protein 13 n=1 Tax=Urochloa decumbens TaxID=240449 RepID=A0ABC9C3A2_9POAL
MSVSPELEGLRRIAPSRFLSFSFPNPFLGHASDPYGDGGDGGGDAGECLRIAVLDSPLPAPPIPRTAAMLVPAGRHRDWIFSTRAGHLHLLLSTQFSRLILVGPELSAPSPRVIPCAARPDPDPAHARLLPLLLALCPVALFRDNAVPDVPLLTFHDDILLLAPVKFITGTVVGEMVVEDVAIGSAPGPPELCRRLRFKRMPCLVQTQVRLCQLPAAAAAAASLSLLEALEGSDGMLQPEVGGSLVQPYLQAMVAGLAVIAPSIEESIQSGVRPRCLCAGVGGGSLPMSIRVGLQFNVLGVEADGVVLGVARNHFGLVEDEFLHVHVGDAIQMIEDFARRGEPDMNFSAVIVDLDSSDAMCGVSAPPLEMIHGSVLLAARTILNQHGVLILNVIPPPADGSFYTGLIDVLRQVFSELYEIDVALRKLAGDFLEHIRKI